MNHDDNPAAQYSTLGVVVTNSSREGEGGSHAPIMYPSGSPTYPPAYPPGKPPYAPDRPGAAHGPAPLTPGPAHGPGAPTPWEGDVVSTASEREFMYANNSML